MSDRAASHSPRAMPWVNPGSRISTPAHTFTSPMWLIWVRPSTIYHFHSLNRSADVPGDDAVSILSNSRLLFIQLRKLRVIWQVPFEELQSLSLEQTGIALILRGGTPGPFLPIGEQTGREWYFKKIGKYVLLNGRIAALTGFDPRVVTTYNNKTHSQRDD